MKVICITNKDGSFTKGKEYDIVWNSYKIKDNSIGDIKILDNDGDPYTMSYDELPNYKFNIVNEK
jgi:hypothetical protein